MSTSLGLEATTPWVIGDPPPGHRLPLDRVLDLLAAPVADVNCERLFRLLAFVAPFDGAQPVEYVLQGKTLLIRKSGEMHSYGSESFIGNSIPLSNDSLDPAHAVASTLACGRGCDSRVFALHCRAEEHSKFAFQLTGEVSPACERFSLLYAFAPDTAWALHLYRRPGEEFRDDHIAAICAVARLIRQVHRAGCPLSERADDRVGAAEVQLGLRAPELSKRERQVCARVAVGCSTETIATELCVAQSTVQTLRKRAYSKLGIHDRMRLTRLVG